MYRLSMFLSNERLVLSSNIFEGWQPCDANWSSNNLEFERQLIICLSLFCQWRHWCLHRQLHVHPYFLTIFFISRKYHDMKNDEKKDQRNNTPNSDQYFLRLLSLLKLFFIDIFILKGGFLANISSVKMLIFDCMF